MTRKDPESDLVAFIKQPKGDSIEQTREYQVITPIFGGGVEPREADPITVVRGSTIRGQLRFWWRATRGGQFGGNLAKMMAAESAIFGAAATFGKDGPSNGPSAINIQVIVRSPGKEIRPYRLSPGKDANSPKPEYDKGSNIPSYVAFPLQPQQADLKSGKFNLYSVREGVSFTLILRYPSTVALSTGEHIDLDRELQAALWTWETFGGIGGRTRRGFGALLLQRVNNEPNLLPSSHEIESWITDWWNYHRSAGDWPIGIAHFPRDPQTALAINGGWYWTSSGAWNMVALALEHFRQRRDRSSRIPGPNLWPEPNAIRKLKGGEPKGTMAIGKFPRAAFGLPIIFHFKDRNEPADTTLMGSAEMSRLASPILLRPLACANAEYIGLALRLSGSEKLPEPLALNDGTRSLPVNSALTPQEAAKIPVLNGQVDVLQAFLTFFKEFKDA